MFWKGVSEGMLYLGASAAQGDGTRRQFKFKKMLVGIKALLHRLTQSSNSRSSYLV